MSQISVGFHAVGGHRAGPYALAVGSLDLDYIDPGNFTTNITAGARRGFLLVLGEQRPSPWLSQGVPHYPGCPEATPGSVDPDGPLGLHRSIL